MNAYQQGMQARIAGESLEDNPYFLNSSNWKRWQQGWHDAYMGRGKL